MVKLDCVKFLAPPLLCSAVSLTCCQEDSGAGQDGKLDPLPALGAAVPRPSLHLNPPRHPTATMLPATTCLQFPFLSPPFAKDLKSLCQILQKLQRYSFRPPEGHSTEHTAEELPTRGVAMTVVVLRRGRVPRSISQQVTPDFPGVRM